MQARLAVVIHLKQALMLHQQFRGLTRGQGLAMSPFITLIFLSQWDISFRVWVMILEPWYYLKLKWVTRHWQLNSLAWQKQTPRTWWVSACPTDAQWGRRVRFMIGAHSKYSLALTFRIFLCDCYSFTIKYLLWLFWGVQRWTTTSPLERPDHIDGLSECMQFLWSWSFMSRLLKYMLICSVVPSFSSPWVPSKKCTSIKIYS